MSRGAMSARFHPTFVGDDRSARDLPAGKAEPIRTGNNTAGEKNKEDQEDDPAAAATARTAAPKAKARLEKIKERVEQKEFEETLQATLTAVHDCVFQALRTYVRRA